MTIASWRIALENETYNECCCRTRPVFPSEALSISGEQSDFAMIKGDGRAKTVDWSTALERWGESCRRTRPHRAEHGAEAIGALATPQSTLAELIAGQGWGRGLGGGQAWIPFAAVGFFRRGKQARRAMARD